MAKPKNIAIINFSYSRLEAIVDLNKLYDFSSQMTTGLDIQVTVSTLGVSLDFKSYLYDLGLQINGVDAICKVEGDYEKKQYTYSKVYTKFIDSILHISFKHFENYDPTIKATFCIRCVFSGSIYYLNCYIDDNMVNQYKFYNKLSQMIASNMESFMLLRTNPKLTGNIKLVVTEDSKLYLDAFKVSSTSVLNNKKYRHKEVSADGDYAHDVYSVFGELPAGEMYAVYPDSLNPQKNRYNLNDLIENIYEYGAEFNSDVLYSENMKILAPLYVGKHLPTYFVVFKTSHMYTSDYNQTSKEMFTDLLKQSEAIKIFDLRQTTTIGKYLNNFKASVDTYLSGVCSLQFIEQENDRDSSNYRQGKNTWKGISYTKGIFSESTETSYFATQILNGSAPQENYDMFLVNGFSRNSLLYPNILNLEFMFNDPDADDFKLYNYFGLYLTENEFLTFNQISTQKETNGDDKVKYVNEDNTLNSEPLKTLTTLLNDSNYSDRLFFMSTLSDVASIKTASDAHSFIKQNVLNLPDKNLVQIHGDLVTFEETEKSFITMKFTEQIQKGEHFRFILIQDSKQNIEKHKVLEIIASDDIRLVDHVDYVNPFVSTNTGDFAYSDATGTEIYRMTFYVNDISDSTQLASLSDQLDRVKACIAKFDSFIYVLDKTSDGLSIISNYENTVFLHILGEIYDENKAVSKDDYIHYFTNNNTAVCYKLDHNTDMFKDAHLKYSLSGFETLGSRYASMLMFMNTRAYSGNYVYEIAKDLYKELSDVLYPIISVDSTMMYAPIVKQQIKEGHLDSSTVNGSYPIDNYESYNTILSPFDITKSLVVSPYIARPFNNMLNICSPLKCSISLMGINDIKDIDMYVDYTESKSYTTLTSADFAANESVTIDNSDPRLRKCVAYRLVKGSLKDIPLSSGTIFMLTRDQIYFYDNSKSGTTYKDVSIRDYKDNFITFNEDTQIELASTLLFDLYNYVASQPKWSEANFYQLPAQRNKLYKQAIGAFSTSVSLTTPLIPAVNCKWRSNGEYFDNVNTLDVTDLKSYVKGSGNFVQNIYTPTSKDNNQYVINSIDDVVSIDGTLTTFREIMMTGAYSGSIKKFLISNFLPETAIGFYNANVQTLDFIYYGIKFTLKLTNSKYANDIRLDEYNNYEVFVMNDYNHKANEIFISSDEQFILIINHNYNPSNVFSTPNIKSLANSKSVLTDVSYGAYSADYSYSLIHTAYLRGNYYLQKSKNEIIDKSLVSYMIELDLPEYSSDADFSEKAVYTYVDVKNTNFKSCENYDVVGKNPQTSIYGIIGYVDDDSTGLIMKYDASTLTDLVKAYNESYGLDFRTKHTYQLCLTDTSVVTDTEQAFLDSLSLDKYDLDIYFINNGLATSLNVTADYQPLSISMQATDKIKYHQGLFNLSFKKIFEFETSDAISDAIDLDTVYANTHLKSVNTIPQYYYWKVMSGNNIAAMNYFKVAARNVCSTDWDKNIYRLYTDNNTYQYLPGYMSGITDKMFFASKCLNMHSDGIYLEEWDENIANMSVTSSQQGEQSKPSYVSEITLNISAAFNDTLLNNQNLRSNWADYQGSAQFDSYVNNYIKNTLLLYYDLNNVEVELYSKYQKSLNIATLEHTAPSDFSSFTLMTNYKTTIKKIADVVRLTINITTDDITHYRYYPVVKIKRH